MNRSLFVLGALACVGVGADAFAQASRQVAIHTQTLPGTTFRAVALDDWDGDGVADYAVSNPSPLSPGPRVATFSGLTGAALPQSLPAGGGFLGVEMCLIDDLDGDGLSELLCASPVLGSVGGITILYSNLATPPFSVSTGNSQGQALTRLDDITPGLAAFAVSSGVGTEVWTGVAGSSIPALVTTLSFTPQTNGLCNAGTVGGLPAMAMQNLAVPDQVIVVDIANTVQLTVNGPAGSNYGNRLSGLGTGYMVIGAPAAGGGAGLVEVRKTTNGALLASYAGAAGDALGSQVAALGDVDGDGANDFAATTGGGTSVLIGGALFTNALSPLLPTLGGTFGLGLGSYPDSNGDGFDEILVTSGTSSFMYLGGPDGLKSNFAVGCDQGTGFVPVLDIVGQPTIGPGNVFTLAGASPNSVFVLAVGFPQLNAVPFPPCFLHLNSSQSVLVAVTDAAGAFTTGPLTLPTAPGVDIGFQALVVDASSGLFEFSNTLNVLLGW